MIYIKSPEEIRIIKEGGRLLAKILASLAEQLRPGLETAALEDLALKLIDAAGGRPAFKNYPMGGGIFFPSAVCVSINDEVVHGASLPNRVIKAGDIVDLDIGMEWPVQENLRRQYKAPLNPHSTSGGFFTDMCATYGIGKISVEAKKLLRVSRECLNLAIKEVKPGNTINDLARAVERQADKYGYGVVRDLVGHGVGYFAHERPDVYNFVIPENSPDNIILKSGMVIAIEPMINAGDWRVKIAKNGYTVVTADHSLSAHFEHTVAVTDKGMEILTI